MRGKRLDERETHAAGRIIPARAGQTRRRNVQQWFGRIIPARAGQTVDAVLTARPPPDHPRACGANSGGKIVVDNPPGSSPRVRGKRAKYYTADDSARIIPARAGQTLVYFCVAVLCSDHPRACGANAVCNAVNAPVSGSSPCVRGKQP